MSSLPSLTLTSNDTVYSENVYVINNQRPQLVRAHELANAIKDNGLVESTKGYSDTRLFFPEGLYHFQLGKNTPSKTDKPVLIKGLQVTYEDKKERKERGNDDVDSGKRDVLLKLDDDSFADMWELTEAIYQFLLISSMRVFGKNLKTIKEVEERDMSKSFRPTRDDSEGSNTFYALKARFGGDANKPAAFYVTKCDYINPPAVTSVTTNYRVCKDEEYTRYRCVVTLSVCVWVKKVENNMKFGIRYTVQKMMVMPPPADDDVDVKYAPFELLQERTDDAFLQENTSGSSATQSSSKEEQQGEQKNHTEGEGVKEGNEGGGEGNNNNDNNENKDEKMKSNNDFFNNKKRKIQDVQQYVTKKKNCK